MTDTSMQPRVRCRQIGEADIGSVVDLLSRGFAGRSRRYWMKGFERLTARALPENVPRFGFMLESDGVPVGVIVLLYGHFGTGDGLRLRCNLSSWFVVPEFRSQASLLVFFALKHKHVTYLNISPARHTWPTIEAQGFKRYASGQFFSVPAFNSTVAGCRVQRVTPDLAPDRFAAMPDRALLIEHAAMGCWSLMVEAPDGVHPFVFLPVRIRSGRVPLPMLQIIYCRDIADYVRFAGPIGRFLLGRGMPFVVHDADGPQSGLVGYFRSPMAPKYFRGPAAPRLGDLAYTERVLFGP